MGVQVRVTGSGVPVIEPAAKRTPRRQLRDAVPADPREQRVRLDQRQTVSDRGGVRVRDPGLGARVGECPQHTGGLRQRERQIEPGDGDRRFPGVLLLADPRDFVRPVGPRQACREVVDALRDALSRGQMDAPQPTERARR